MNHKLLTIGLIFLLINTGFGQTETSEQRLHELGAVISGNLNFGADYKVGTATKLWRFSAFGAAGEWGDNYQVGQSPFTTFKNNINVSVGHEWRKSLFDNFFFASGIQLGLSYDIEVREVEENLNMLQYNQTTHLIRPSVGVVLGLRYILKDKVNFSLTWIPSINYGHRAQKSTVRDQQTIVNESWDVGNSFGYRASWSSLRLVIAYRFYTDKKKKEKTAPPAKS